MAQKVGRNVAQHFRRKLGLEELKINSNAAFVEALAMFDTIQKIGLSEIYPVES